LEEAFRRSRQMNHGKVSAWLLSQFQSWALAPFILYIQSVRLASR
jgi:hypothetical protein